ncbi:SAGA-associated factor 29-like [Actinia tenebrosa]|uniref:SAGA-associated factor 29-like n=1 Tax=Actinia tenebrosa TaxID=6105 RepID=A0A6P8HC57_ACTTE|nr:SAGA-associated factor 29-like [Actinia tenebrosa]
MRRSRGPSSVSSVASSSSGGGSNVASNSSSSNNTAVPSLLKELHSLVQQIQEERNRSEHNINNIAKTHEKMKTEGKVSSYFKTKLRGLYKTATSDAEAEADIIRKALDKIAIIKALRNDRRIGRSGVSRNQESGEPRKAMRRGVLMTMLQQAASHLPMMIGKASESSPPLCGAVQADSNYIAQPGDHVAARVKTSDGEEQWILAEIVSFNTSTNKYDVDDIDEEGKNGKERHHLSRRRVVPLPKQKANPLTHPNALFQKDQVVMALYPQTTCFYKAVIHEPPARPQDDYLVSFEDTSYADGFAPPLHVPQRYVVIMKDNKRR